MSLLDQLGDISLLLLLIHGLHILQEGLQQLIVLILLLLSFLLLLSIKTILGLLLGRDVLSVGTLLLLEPFLLFLFFLDLLLSPKSVEQSEGHVTAGVR